MNEARDPMVDASPASHERVLSFGASALCVRADGAALLDWLVEFLSPWFDVPSPPTAAKTAASIEVAIDAPGLERWIDGATPTGRERVCFQLDRAPVLWPVFRGADGGERALDLAGRVSLAVERTGGGPVFRIVSACDRPGARLAAFRVVRELASEGAIAAGWLPLHAAAVQGRSGVTLFVGPKRAGKSSLLLHALVGHGARYVANDRVMVELAGAAHARLAAHARGMPSIVGVREGSLAWAGGLGSALASGAWHYTTTVAEARAHARAGQRAEAAGEIWPPGLTPAQLCALLGVEPVAGGPIARIVFPSVHERLAGARRFLLRALAAEEAARLLRETGLLANGSGPSGLAPIDGGGPPALDERIRRLAASVPSVECQLAPGAYDEPSVWRALADEAFA